MEIKLDPLKYNGLLIGESGIGKTTVIKEYLEKLAGNDGYMFLEIGKEDGADAIHDIVYETCEDWDKFSDVIDDIVENKSSDYPELKVIAIDTIDELFRIAEPEVVDMHNRSVALDKHVKSIKAAFGGFQAGEDKAVEIVLDKLWSLKDVGVSFVIIGHTKTKSVTDPVTGQDYYQVTTNMPQRYFNAIKTKAHWGGVAAVDRKIVKEKTGKKDIITKQELTKGVVKEEVRKITFRDDNFVIDSKSRFAEIIEEIPLDADALIKAVTDAIHAAHSKGTKSLEQSQKEQAEAEAKMVKDVAKAEEQAKKERELKEVIAEITGFIKENRTDKAKINPIIEASKSKGFANPTLIDNIKDAKAILKLIS